MAAISAEPVPKRSRPETSPSTDSVAGTRSDALVPRGSAATGNVGSPRGRPGSMGGAATGDVVEGVPGTVVDGPPTVVVGPGGIVEVGADEVGTTTTVVGAAVIGGCVVLPGTVDVVVVEPGADVVVGGPVVVVVGPVVVVVGSVVVVVVVAAVVDVVDIIVVVVVVVGSGKVAEICTASKW